MTERTYNALPLHESLNLYVSPTAYIFEPASNSPATASTLVDEKESLETLFVDRRTVRMALNEPVDAPHSGEKVITCYGILGVLSLATTDFLVIITARQPSCRLLSHPIYLATDYRLLPLSPLSTSSSILNHPVEKELISLVEQGLKAGKMWFSYGLDLTNTMQRQQDLENQGNGMGKWPAWKRADERFFWNRFLMGRMIDLTENGNVDLSRFMLPVIFGSIELRQTVLNNRDLLFLLISRRSRHRAGTRFFSRGIDTLGNVSNFNETEQILLYDPIPPSGEIVRRGRVEGKERLSFVQVRGSAPFFFAEVNNLRYKPDLQVMDVPETIPALRQHLHSLMKNYNEVHLINLVNHKGYELPVKDAFERNMSTVSSQDPEIAAKAHYRYFDFHTECKGMRFDRISLLIDALRTDLERMGYFYSASSSEAGSSGKSGELSGSDIGKGMGREVKKRQEGVVRCNCMDCLDRTNVSQSALGQWAVNEQLRHAGILSVKEKIADHPEFILMFRTVWAEHGETVSKAYSGTGALKADYTRTGKRTKQGLLEDGYKSAMRYILNNFFDGDRQDAYDIITGGYVAKRGGIPPLTDTRPLIMRAMPYIFAFALTMIIAAGTLPRTSELSLSSFVYFWFLLAFASGTYIWGNGVSYVAWPRLNPPIAILSYNGPGARSIQRGRGLTVDTIFPLSLIFKKSSKRAAPPVLAQGRSKTGDELEMGRRKGALID